MQRMCIWPKDRYVITFTTLSVLMFVCSQYVDLVLESVRDGRGEDMGISPWHGIEAGLNPEQLLAVARETSARVVKRVAGMHIGFDATALGGGLRVGYVSATGFSGTTTTSKITGQLQRLLRLGQLQLLELQ